MQKKQNSLFETLELFTKLYFKHYTLNSLISNLPIKKGQSEPDLFNHSNLEDNFSKSARKAGLSSKILKQDIKRYR
ncbi:MAG: hypothetical protein U9N02_09015 [Campylobacterota bacterium]|nr:hypothetical protein [Campylobacterota bacterium]